MNIVTKFLITWLRLVQHLGFSAKTYNIFNPLPKLSLRRKGHILHNPSQEQVDAIRNSIIKKSRIQWKITDHRDHYDDFQEDNKWLQRPLDVIDKIVLASTNNQGWTAQRQYQLDTTADNPVTPGRPLPGISYHLFVNASGIIEQVSDYENVLYHTPGVNYRSIGVLIQYSVENNNAEPTSKILSSLIRLLTVLCLQFKLDPYKAIVGQSEIMGRLPVNLFGKGRPSSERENSPGPLVPMNHIRQKTAAEIQKKLLYGDLFHGTINGEMDNVTRDGINKFHSPALQKLYTTGIISYERHQGNRKAIGSASGRIR